MSKGAKAWPIRFLIMIVAAAAALQWAVVAERVWAAVWAWYKFTGYGGGGHIVVGRTTQIAFSCGSVALAVVGYWLSKSTLDHTSVIWRGAAQFSWVSIIVCTVLWWAVLLSPLLAFRSGR